MTSRLYPRAPAGPVRSIFHAALLAILVSGCASGPARAPITGHSFDESFETQAALPPGWLRVVGNWSIVDEPTAPAGSRVLEQDGGRNGSWPLLVATGRGTFGDVEITARIRLLNGSQDVAAGVLARYVDFTHYYAARISFHDGNARLLKLDGGPVWVGPTYERHFRPLDWTTVGVRAQAGTLTVTIDGAVALEWTDPSPFDVGYAGLWVSDDTRAQFDAVHVARLDG